jgi:hypothetical protein
MIVIEITLFALFVTALISLICIAVVEMIGKRKAAIDR